MTAARVSAAVAIVVLTCATGAGAAPPRENAKAIFQEGERNFQLGKFEAAIEAYERAFNLDPQPAFIFNIALAHRRQFEIDGKLEHLLRARELYRNYLKLDPTSPNRPGVEKLITELGARIDQTRARAVVVEPPAASTAPASAPAAVVAAPPPPVAAAPTPESPPLVNEPALVNRPVEKSSSTRTWLLAGGITAAVIAAAVTILLVTRSDQSFDGPGIDLTPQ
jgi:tetratricopeptide (TPR) repeat protein